ncbi:hypothetical protein Nepgr_020367 [Nepenthes gracilis]|uniref:Uncharacterized protein n=1 Tax=Nepenthes gracilis TaxID=150966 RepID=A0AAD3XWA4_NEPGR|nr:hypothetical protein Nepgr_020367 [Nepenthes gracilis]
MDCCNGMLRLLLRLNGSCAEGCSVAAILYGLVTVELLALDDVGSCSVPQFGRCYLPLHCDCVELSAGPLWCADDGLVGANVVMFVLKSGPVSCWCTNPGLCLAGAAGLLSGLWCGAMGFQWLMMLRLLAVACRLSPVAGILEWPGNGCLFCLDSSIHVHRSLGLNLPASDSSSMPIESWASLHQYQETNDGNTAPPVTQPSNTTGLTALSISKPPRANIQQSGAASFSATAPSTESKYQQGQLLTSNS